MSWLGRLITRGGQKSVSGLPDANNLKVRFSQEIIQRKENTWRKIRTSIEDAMSCGKSHVSIDSDVYQNIPLKELRRELKKSHYKLRDNTLGVFVRYCYNMGFTLYMLVTKLSIIRRLYG